MKPDFETTTQARYECMRELGRGGTTRVELVYDPHRQLTLARKIWDNASAELRFRLRQQHRRALNIIHPNIVRVYDLTADSDQTAMTMEFVSGAEASAYIRELELAGVPEDKVLGATLHVLRQLSEALRALHAADIVHREVRPRNLLVEQDGRAVLLDAGFAWPPQKPVDAELDSSLAHVLPYLAPECLRGALHSVESDWYGFGALSAELFLGRPLFEGTLAAALHAKDAPIESLRDTRPIVSDALDDLIRALLSRDPRARPGYEEIEEVLEDLCLAYPFSLPISATVPPPSKPSHVQLRASAIEETGQAAAHRSPEQATQLYEIDLEFALPDPSEAPALLAPYGLSQPAESSSGAIEELRTEARDDTPSTLEAAVAQELSGSVDLQQPTQPLDDTPSMLEGAVAQELSELVDTVLRDLRDPLPSPPPGVPAAASELRTEDAAACAWDARAQPEARSDQVDTEQTTDPTDLPAPEIVPDARADAPQLPALTAPLKLALGRLLELIDAEASPSLLCVRGCAGSGKTTLADALVQELQRADRIVAHTRAYLAAPALAALQQLSERLAHELGDRLSHMLKQIEPARRSALARLCPALSFSQNDLHIDACATNPQQRLLDAQLGLRSLMRCMSVERHVVIVIDDAEQLDSDTASAIRALLSSAEQRLSVIVMLDSSTPIVESIACLLEGLPEASSLNHVIELDPPDTRRSRPAPAALAGESTAAADNSATPRKSEDLLREAREATAALALQRAAQLYQRALESEPSPCEQLLRDTALACVAAGHLRDAAQLWLSLARTTSDALQAQHYELEAAAYYLRAGDFELGQSLMRGVLRSVGVHWPRTPLLMSTVERARALLRHGRPKTAATTAPQPAQLARFDALWCAAKELMGLSPSTADALSARALREAQDCQSPSRLLWALGYEATSEANVGGAFMHRRASALASEVRELAGKTASAYDLAYAGSVEALVAWFSGEWVQSEKLLRGALQAYACMDGTTAQERHVLSTFMIGALEAQGKLVALREHVAEERIAALQTGHRGALAFCELSAAGLIDLADDRPLQAIDRADALLAAFADNAGFTALHLLHFVTTTQARLYAGHHAQAYQQVEHAWQQLRRTYLGQLEGVSVTVHQVRARAIVALAQQSTGADAENLRAQALRLAATLGRSNLTHALAMRHVIEANVAALASQREAAEAHCLRAAELFDVADMPLLRETSRMARSALGQCVEATLDAEQSTAFLRQAGVRDCARFAATWFPALRSQLQACLSRARP